ncbi:WD40 repeat-like protein [Terfezia boudieri ATCC MYA-4762]|uniref:WD40 repeat-like protein n=1 Tax=Terfezia boudieri ATCC MYA-4762 TaxID=1051890 RepID=A0A3N4LZ42_9PEZI|nr:WD40 repeat-like protein [Terfezia boudieri ATCC MYA-4762]
MKVGFKFSNLLGTVYCRGNLLFTPDGNALLSPVGNRVTCFDLVNNKSFTFTFEHRKNIARIALNPQATLLLSVDEDGRAILTNFIRRTPLHHFNFKSKVQDIKFSPDGKFFAVAAGRHVEVWKTPQVSEEREFAPFVRHRVYTGHFDVINSITWSGDSRFFLTGSKDLTAKVFSLNPVEGFVPTSLAAHKGSVIGSYFSKDQETIYTVSKDGICFEWKYKKRSRRDIESDDEMDEDEEEKDPSKMQWRIENRFSFKLDQRISVKCTTFHPAANLLVVGFSSGTFGLYEVPEFNIIHKLSISNAGIDFVTINKTGEWLAFGASKLGQLLVWEWQSESYILKQQGHFDAMNSIVYSPDGQRIITTADDGKIKVWEASSGFCIVTFTEHSSGVTACEFAKRGNVLFTASLDGSVRAWDLIRYRNFRTFTSPSRLSFSSLTVDPSGEVVCAGSLESFDIHLWSVQTGQLLDRLQGHEAPISSLSFAPDGSFLVSGSWDKSVRIWTLFGRTQTSEQLPQSSDVLSVSCRPDSKEIAVATLDGQVTFWDVNNSEQKGIIDGKRDISGGRKISDLRTAANNAATKHFTTITYSADGTCVLAAGNSKYICLYDVASGSIIRKFTVSQNLSIDGTQEMLSSRNMTEAGARDLLDDQGEASDIEDRIDHTLPGATRGDFSARKVRPEIRVTGLAFSPTGRAFTASSTEGLLVYSLDDSIVFDPFDLDVDITPASTLATVKAQPTPDYLKALVMSLRLNERYIIHNIYESIPQEDIRHVVKDLPVVYLSRLLRFVAEMCETTPHLEFCLLWIEALLACHGRYLRERGHEFASDMRVVQKAVGKIQSDLAKMADQNIYTLDYLLSQPATANNKKPENFKLPLHIKNVDMDAQEDLNNNGSDIVDDEEWHGLGDAD